MKSKLINGTLPPKLPLLSFPHMVQVISLLLFNLQMVENLSELHVEITNNGVSVCLNKVVGTRLLWRILCGVTINEGLDFQMAERKCLIRWRENHNSDLYLTKGAKLTSFLERSQTTLRECNLQMTLFGYFLNFWRPKLDFLFLNMIERRKINKERKKRNKAKFFFWHWTPIVKTNVNYEITTATIEQEGLNIVYIKYNNFL